MISSIAKTCGKNLYILTFATNGVIAKIALYDIDLLLEGQQCKNVWQTFADLTLAIKWCHFENCT